MFLYLRNRARDGARGHLRLAIAFLLHWDCSLGLLGSLGHGGLDVRV